MAPTPLATAADVSDELGGELSSSEISERWLNRAAHLVTERVPNADDWLREELEILVTAHFAYPRITGSSTASEISSITQGSASISYESTEGPDGISSPYWTHAVELSDGEIDDTGQFFSETLR